MRHGVAGIGGEVHEHLVHLRHVASAITFFPSSGAKLDILMEEPLEEFRSALRRGC